MIFADFEGYIEEMEMEQHRDKLGREIEKENYIFNRMMEMLEEMQRKKEEKYEAARERIVSFEETKCFICCSTKDEFVSCPAGECNAIYCFDCDIRWMEDNDNCPHCATEPEDVQRLV